MKVSTAPPAPAIKSAMLNKIKSALKKRIASKTSVARPPPPPLKQGELAELKGKISEKSKESAPMRETLSF